MTDARLLLICGIIFVGAGVPEKNKPVIGWIGAALCLCSMLIK